MLHWLAPSQSSLVGQYVECYWMIEKTSGSQGIAFPKLNPDPCAHLILSPVDHRYHYDIAGNVAQGQGCHWMFPHQQTYLLDHTEAFIHIGVKFRIGALYALEIPNYEHPTCDEVIDVNLAAWLGITELPTLFALARHDADTCVKQLDRLLAPWLATGQQDRHSQWVEKVLPLLDTTAIADLGERVFCSQRTLERSFRRVTGFSLKQCQSMRKLEAILEYLYQRDADTIDWPAVALQFGFSDQPHLIRYVKSQLGLTPSTYASERGLTIDVYGGGNPMSR
ncbi:helix-turn-helix domain-containing protein [Photobacterium japonica]|uniref:AraC family transcriptional regulator n=1 Tax=Photobacterium japonica TaxID=2910235 RepID=UPI003D0DAAB5